jgi:hypothetical protein
MMVHMETNFAGGGTMDHTSGSTTLEKPATVQEVEALVAKIKRRLVYLEQYAPEKLPEVLAEVQAIRALL